MTNDRPQLVRRAFALFASLMALFAIATSSAGCAGDAYYCNADGCFFCDGTSCRRVDPPAPTTCTRNSECPSGQVCTDRGCLVQGCTRDTDCAQGYACRHGSNGGANYCAPVDGTQPVPVTPRCTTNANCVAGEVCIDGQCQTSTTPGCSTDAQCTGGRICVSGRCEDRANTCQFDNQCGAGRLCINSECRDTCSAASCPAGTECVTQGALMYCRNTAPTGCANDAACGASQRCLNGSCLDRCVPGSATCGAGRYCSDDGVCVPDTRTRPFCDAAHPCAAGSECIGGVCRVPCTTSPMCQMVDVTYRNCATIPYIASSRTYCVTDNEARPTCSRQIDCASGQSCANGTCR